MEGLTLTINKKVINNLVDIINIIWNTDYDSDSLKTISLEEKRFDLKFKNGHGYSISYKIFAEYTEDSDFNAMLN